MTIKTLTILHGCRLLILTISAKCQANCKLQESIFSKNKSVFFSDILVLKVAYFYTPSDLTNAPWSVLFRFIIIATYYEIIGSSRK